jgi:hypothetical protein
VVEYPAGGLAGVDGKHEQQVLGADLALSAPGRQPPGLAHGLVGLAVADDAVLPAALAAPT